MDFFKVSRETLGCGAKIPLKKLGDSGEVFYELALDMLTVIEEKNARNERAVLICPVGPVGQYPIFTRLVNERRVSLKNTWFLNMDEYLDENDEWIDSENQLSFRGFMQREVYARIDPALVMPEDQRVFPDPAEPSALPALIERLGGVDLAVGGIGVNGHLAFNEARNDMTAEQFAALPTRVLEISRETRAVNAVGELGGAIDAMPRRCVTIGMAEILRAQRVRIGVFRDWHRAVVRQAAYGAVSAHFPATLLQRHLDALIYVNHTAAAQPF